MIFAKGGRIFRALNGYQPISARTACSFNSVAPQMSDAPNVPSKAEIQTLEIIKEAITIRIPDPITYGHHRYPKYRSPRITQTNPSPIIGRVTIPRMKPKKFIGNE